MAALAILLLGAPTGVGAEVPRPVIVFWTAYPFDLPHISHFTPNVRLGPPTDGGFSQEELLSAGVFPLRTAPGKSIAAGLTAEELASRWAAAWKQGYRGIAIDEFGSPDGTINTRMLKALAIARSRAPGLFIAVWHAGVLGADFADAYRRYADLVMLETYTAAERRLWMSFGSKLRAARRGGILAKTVFALGINDVDKRLGKSVSPWANTRQALETQMRWIRARAPSMPGIAFFASHASREIQVEASNLAWSLFGPARP